MNQLNLQDKAGGDYLNATEYMQIRNKINELVTGFNQLPVPPDAYVHPDSHPASMIQETEEKQFVSAVEKAAISSSNSAPSALMMQTTIDAGWTMPIHVAYFADPEGDLSRDMISFSNSGIPYCICDNIYGANGFEVIYNINVFDELHEIRIVFFPSAENSHYVQVFTDGEVAHSSKRSDQWVSLPPRSGAYQLGSAPRVLELTSGSDIFNVQFQIVNDGVYDEETDTFEYGDLGVVLYGYSNIETQVNFASRSTLFSNPNNITTPKVLPV